jgi:hypothetical protein
MGCIYTAINYSAIKNGIFKIGMTEDKYPTKRFNANELLGVYYLSCPKATRAELLMLECVARCCCIDTLNLNQVKNDWFPYTIDKRYKNKMTQAETFAQAVMSRVITECEKRNIEYALKACHYKGKNYSCVTAVKLNKKFEKTS